MYYREAKTIKDRENAWETIEKLAIQNPNVTKLASPHKAFKQSMLSQLTPINSETVDDSVIPSRADIDNQAKVIYM